MIGRRTFLAATGAAAAMAVPEVAQARAGQQIRPWINRNARPLRSTAADGPLHDLRSLSHIAGPAAVLGLGESVHGSHTLLTMRHRACRYLVEHLGFRTIAWEEGWGSGVAIDRFVTSGVGTAEGVVNDAMFMLRSEAMLDLVRWMREFNSGRPRHDRVRFLGADVVEVRSVQYSEIRRYVADVAPARLSELESHLGPIDWRGDTWPHLQWYQGLTEPEKHVVLRHARAVSTLVSEVGGRSEIASADAQQHALAIVGFHEAYSARGDAMDARDRNIARILTDWRRRTGHRIAYCAVNAHTAGIPTQLVSFPDGGPGEDVVLRRLAGGLLRRRFGRRYVSVAGIFDSGQVFTGWQDEAGPRVYDIPSPDPAFVDHVLGRARRHDYLLDLWRPADAQVRRWLVGKAMMRTFSASYDPARDIDYSHTMDSWRGAFDAVLHVDEVEAARMLPY